MKCLHAGNFDDLLKYFGFDKTKIVQEVEKVLGRKLLKPKQQEQAAAPQKPTQAKQQEFKPMTAENAADFFNQLGSKANTASNNNAEEEKKEEEAPQPKESKLVMQTETISRNTNWDEGIEGVIKKNLLIGNLEYAAEVALKAGRTAEALLIADAGGE
jgi:NACalpha-BTF3-like transcription factor